MSANHSPRDDLNALDALQAIGDVVQQMAMKLAVVELALREAVSTMPQDQKTAFSYKLKARVEAAMQNSANKLMPADDAELSRAAMQLLDAAK